MITFQRKHLIILIAAVIFIYFWYSQEVKSLNPLTENFITAAKPECYPGERAAGADKICRTCANVQEPSYLNEEDYPDQSMSYAQSIIGRQAEQIKNLRKKVKKLAFKLDDSSDAYYRKKLSNKYYRPKPFLAKYKTENVLNLNDDDFSGKTLSTIKFLSQTRPSRYFGNEIHFPTELCGSYCSTSDPNAEFHEQIDLVRPISPTDYIPRVK